MKSRIILLISLFAICFSSRAPAGAFLKAEAESLWVEGSTVTPAAQRWAHNRLGIPYPRIAAYLSSRASLAPYPVMSSPPMITRVGTTSTNGAYTNGATLYQPTISNARMVCSGSEFTATTLGGRNILNPAHITLTTGALSIATCPYRVRFMSDAPSMDLCFRELVGTSFSVVIDGQMVSRQNVTPFSNSGDYSYFKVNFGADTTTYRKAASNSIVKGTAAGATTNAAGYAMGATSLTLASAGSGNIVNGDTLTFAGDVNKYVVATGDADVSNGGTIVLQSPGLLIAMSAAPKAITVVGGTGYAQGDLVTFNGGSGGAGGSPLIVKIGAVTSGAVTSGSNLTIMDGGAYTTLPTGTFTQVSTTGVGTGLQISASFFHPMHAQRRMRHWEIIVSGVGAFFGIVPETNDVVLPWAEPADQPKVVFVGDSNSAGTYLDYAGGHLPTLLAQALGVHDRYIVSAQGGTGWTVASDTSPAWSHANRLADFVRYDGDLYIFMGSQNDAATANATITASVTATLNGILAANPRALIVGLSNILSSSAGPDAAIAAGFAAASDQNRVRYISSQLPIPWLNPTYYSKYHVTGDSAHLSREGCEFYATTAATQIRDAILSMTR